MAQVASTIRPLGAALIAPRIHVTFLCKSSVLNLRVAPEIAAETIVEAGGRTRDGVVTRSKHPCLPRTIVIGGAAALIRVETAATPSHREIARTGTSVERSRMRPIHMAPVGAVAGTSPRPTRTTIDHWRRLATHQCLPRATTADLLLTCLPICSSTGHPLTEAAIHLILRTSATPPIAEPAPTTAIAEDVLEVRIESVGA
jgi:hypothetical protein